MWTRAKRTRQDCDDIRHVIDTNVTGTLYLIHKVAQQMADIGNGKILITDSIAGFERAGLIDTKATSPQYGLCRL